MCSVPFETILVVRGGVEWGLCQFISLRTLLDVERVLGERWGKGEDNVKNVVT